MTKSEFDQKVYEINANERDPTARREQIALVTEIYESQERERKERAEGERQLMESMLRDELLEAWLNNGGTEHEFSAAFPELRRKRLEQIALQQAAVAHAESVDYYRSKF